MNAIWDLLVEELEKPRPLSAQVLKHLSGTYGVGRDETGAFLDQRLAELDEAEIDLTLSSLFTPKLTDQARFAAQLGADSIVPSEWPALVEQLHRRPTLGCLVTEEGTSHRVPLQPVTLERYVHRLRLDATIPENLLRLIQSLPPAEDRALLLAIARRSVWSTTARQEILLQFLARSCAAETYRREDAVALLALMESAEPESVGDVRARLPEWERSLRTQLSSASMPRPFFNLQVEEMHGGGRDHRATNAPAVERQRAELEFLARLKKTLGEQD